MRQQSWNEYLIHQQHNWNCDRIFYSSFLWHFQVHIGEWRHEGNENEISFCFTSFYILSWLFLSLTLSFFRTSLWLALLFFAIIVADVFPQRRHYIERKYENCMNECIQIELCCFLPSTPLNLKLNNNDFKGRK